MRRDAKSVWFSQTSPTRPKAIFRARKRCASWLRCKSSRAFWNMQARSWSSGAREAIRWRCRGISVPIFRRGFNTPLVLGANTVESADGDAFNSALLLDQNGVAVGRYDKVELLAFGEYVPGIDFFPWLQNLLPTGTGRFKAGAGPVVMSLPEPHGQTWRLGPLICYEDLLPELIRRVGTLHPDILVNLTSDQWFGAP